MSAARYDEVGYPGKFYPQSSPDRVGVIGALYGVEPAPADRCRVLELGCGDGANLIPLAERFPDSRFLGVDLSPETVARGQALIADLGLANVELVCGDITELQVERGAWDYITSHGVLSWIPEAARQRMFEIFGVGLADHGLAYVSYSCLPGGYLRNYPRDLMRFHTRNITSLEEKAKAARDVARFVDAAAPAGSLVHDILAREMAGTEGKDFFLLHDLLADENEPFYFLDVVDFAAKNGLQYVGESELSAMQTKHLPEGPRAQLDSIASRLEREQYLDFINLRRFRQTIFCRSERALVAEASAAQLERLHIRARLPPGERSNRGTNRARGTSSGSDDLHEALWLALGETRSQPSRLSDLRTAVATRLGGSGLGEAETETLVEALVELFAREKVALHTCRLDYNAEVPDRPAVSPYTRRLAAAGAPVVSRELSAFYLPGDLMRHLVQLLDGSRNHAQLLIDLAGRVGRADQAGLDETTLTKALELIARNALFTD